MFKACGVITLTTDFGLRDPFVGLMKAVILGRYPSAKIIDFTHEIPPQQPQVAGFWLARSFEYCPRGSIHVAVVDPGVGSERRIIALEANEQVFLAPDNGLLAAVRARVSNCRMFTLDGSSLKKLGLREPSATFHGRDIFAPVAAELAAGHCDIDDLGPRVEDIQPGSLSEPAIRGATVVGAVMIVDHFGNLITNIDQRLLSRFVDPQVRVGDVTVPLRRTYSDARPGEYLALINSFEVLEIAQCNGNAAAALSVKIGEIVLLLDRQSP